MAVQPESDDNPSGLMTTPEFDTLLGQTLDGRFKIVEPIGKGGMGKVYRAVQSPLNRAVALKVLDSNYGPGRDEVFRQRFLVEAGLTSKLTHPNTVTVIDYGCTADGILYLAMEYLDGRTLDEVVTSDGPLHWRRVASIAAQVARSLREAHSLGVVHRDLKPANIMVLGADDDLDQVKVLDFGLVKSFVEGQELEGRALTQQGMLVGSPPYMAPEQGERNRADPRSDIYSLGTVLYELLTGKPPFLGKSAMEIILKHVHEAPKKPVAPAGLDPIPEVLTAIVLKCLAKSPMDRFQSMDELLSALQEFSTPGAFTTPSAGTPMTRENAIGLKLAPALIFLVAVIIGGGVAAVLLKSMRPTPAPVPPPVVQIEVKPPEPVIEPEPTAVEPEPAPLPAPRFVVLHVESVPPGARVSAGGKVLGTAPLEFELPLADAAEQVDTDLTFELVGFVPTTVHAGGAGPRLEVTQTLKKLTAAKPAKASPPIQTPKKKVFKKKPAAKSSATVGSKLGDDDEDESPSPASDLKKPSP